MQESVNSGLDYWNGLVDWTTGLTFDLKFSHEMDVKGVRLIAISHNNVIGGEPGGFKHNSVCVGQLGLTISQHITK